MTEVSREKWNQEYPRRRFRVARGQDNNIYETTAT